MVAYKVDTLEMGRGAFQALCDRNAVQVVRSGVTFGVSAYFPVLCLGFIQKRSYLDLTSLTLQELEAYQAKQKRELGNKVKLILPSIEASKLVSIDRAIGLGGGSHEIGHIICDMAGKNVHSDVLAKIFPVLTQFISAKPNLFKVLPTWSNICADIRLENMMSSLYPESKIRFHSIQEWVWNDLEAESRLDGSLAQNPAQALGLMIRDLGKNHQSKSQQRVFNDYATLYPKLWNCAVNAKNLWSQLQVSIKEYTQFKTQNSLDKEIEKSVHLPLVIALQLLMSLEIPKEEDPNQDPSQDPNQDASQPNQDPSQPNQDDSSSDQGNSSQDEDQDEDQDDDDESEDEDQDDDDESEDEDQDDDDESEDQDQDDDESEDQDQEDSQDSDDEDQDDDQDSDDESDEDQDSDGQDDESNDGQDDSQDSDGGEDLEDGQDSQDNEDQDEVNNSSSNGNDDSSGSSSSVENGFDKDQKLDLSQEIDINDIAKAFEKEFQKASSKLEFIPYISNGLKILDIVEN